MQRWCDSHFCSWSASSRQSHSEQTSCLYYRHAAASERGRGSDIWIFSGTFAAHYKSQDNVRTVKRINWGTLDFFIPPGDLQFAGILFPATMCTAAIKNNIWRIRPIIFSKYCSDRRWPTLNILIPLWLGSSGNEQNYQAWLVYKYSYESCLLYCHYIDMSNFKYTQT